jgi:DNA-binding transcriptional MocR family regulator
VIYIGGFSKTLSASLRLGYLAARADLVKALVDVKALTSMGCSRLAERVIATLLERGAHRKHLERLRRRAGEALTQAAALLGGAGWTLYEPPAGGLFAWARAPGVDDSARLAEAARAHGLRLAPGSEHRPDGAATPWVRLNLAHLQDPRARAFVAAVGHAGGDAA